MTDIDTAHKNENESVKAVSNVCNRLIEELQEYSDQTDGMEKALKASVNKCEEFRQTLEIQKVVIDKLISSLTTSTQTCRLAQAQSKKN